MGIAGGEGGGGKGEADGGGGKGGGEGGGGEGGTGGGSKGGGEGGGGEGGTATGGGDDGGGRGGYKKRTPGLRSAGRTRSSIDTTGPRPRRKLGPGEAPVGTAGEVSRGLVIKAGAIHSLVIEKKIPPMALCAGL